jgi:hypothetical protein
MTNFQVYKKTLSYSLVSFAVGLVELVVFAGIVVGSFFIFNIWNLGEIGLPVGLLLGIIFLALLTMFVNNRIKAAQIAMMTKGVVDGELPDKVFKEGFNEVKGRFAKLTLFFMVTGAIKNIFRQLGRTMTRAGRAVGGNVGEGITSAIDSAIQVLVGYLCDCCLGWVMYNKQEKMVTAACQGAVIFFKHGKTLFKNIGRIFGIMALTFILIGGPVFGISYLILNNIPHAFDAIIAEVSTWSGDMPEFFLTHSGMAILASAVIAVLVFSMIHSVLVHPFILTGVLRNYMESGLKDRPTEADFAELDSKSPRFRKLRAKEQN